MINAIAAHALAADRGGRRLFSDLNLRVEAGGLLSVTGPNGSGKTTLLRVLAGLAPAAKGEIAFQSAAGPLAAEDARSRGLHLLGHADGLSTARRAVEELDFWTTWLGGGPAGRAAAIDQFALKPLLDLPVAALSAGQRRRLVLARLVAAPRPLWLLDEPFSPLDERNRRRLQEVMAAHLDGGGLIIASTHDPLPLAGDRLEIPQR